MWSLGRPSVSSVIGALAIVPLLLVGDRVVAKPCVGFDSNWGLYVFGLDRDVSLGPSSNWNANPLGMSNLTRTGRPPFNGTNTQCFLSQFSNALYVLDADTTQPSNIHIFSFDSQSWTTQGVAANGVDPKNVTAILDRDTNVFFGLSNSQLYSLDMGDLSHADGGTRGWGYVQNPPFAQNGAYPNPVMALAQNHIHFLNVGAAATVNIFVIHFSYMQPEQQVFAPRENGGQGFPSVKGHTATIFKDIQSTPQKFAFIPDDGSATFIFDTASNTTQRMQGPTDKSTVMLAASQTELVQMTTSGEVYWIPLNQDDPAPNASAAWKKLALPLHLPATSTNSTRSADDTPASTPTPGSSSSSGSRTMRTGYDTLAVGIMSLGLGICGLLISS